MLCAAWAFVILSRCNLAATLGVLGLRQTSLKTTNPSDRLSHQPISGRLPPNLSPRRSCLLLRPACTDSAALCIEQESKSKTVHNDQLQPRAPGLRNALHSQRLGAPITRLAPLAERVDASHGRSRRPTRSAAAGLGLELRQRLVCCPRPAPDLCLSSLTLPLHSCPPQPIHCLFLL